MRIAVLGSEAGTTVAERMRRRVRSTGARVVDALAEADALVLVGDTRFFLKALASEATVPPVLLVAASGRTALAEVPASEGESAVDRLVAGEHDIQPVTRMRCSWDGAEAFALNEAALLPTINGTFLSYELRLDDELLWRDRGDGVIVTTPIGSTAYARSAGGPIVLSAARVLGVVPISSEAGTAPLIVPQSAKMELTAVEAGGGAQLVVDGHMRHKVGGDGIRVTQGPAPLQVVRFEDRRHAEVLGRVRARGDIRAELEGATPSARFVFTMLEHEGPFTAAQIARATGLTSRTVRGALRDLQKRGLVVRRGTLRDARTSVYDVAGRPSEEKFSSRRPGE